MVTKPLRTPTADDNHRSINNSGGAIRYIGSLLMLCGQHTTTTTEVSPFFVNLLSEHYFCCPRVVYVSLNYPAPGYNNPYQDELVEMEYGHATINFTMWSWRIISYICMLHVMLTAHSR